MALTFTQTDTSVTFDVGCSGESAGATTAAREIVDGGTAGSTEFSVDPNNNSTAAVVAFRTTGGVGTDTWEAGDYVVSINVTSASGNSDWVATYICERTSGGSFNTVASLTGQTTDVATTGVKSQTVNRGTDFTPAGTDSDLFVVLVFTNSDNHGNSSTSITPDQDITTPIVGAASFSGTATQTLGAITQSASGALSFSGTATQTLGSVTQDASGAVVGPVSGTATQTLSAVTQDATGGLSFSATITQTLASVTQDASGSQGETFAGDITNTLASVTQSATGGMSFSATLTQTLPIVTQDLSGGVAFSGTIDQSLSAITQDLQGSTQGAATIDQTLGSMSQTMSASLKFPATGGSVLPSIIQNAEQIGTEVKMVASLLSKDKGSPFNKVRRNFGRNYNRGFSRHR